MPKQFARTILTGFLIALLAFGGITGKSQDGSSAKRPNVAGDLPHFAISHLPGVGHLASLDAVLDNLKQSPIVRGASKVRLV